MIPYGRQSVDEEDIRAVVDVLHSDWLTTGPVVEAFEEGVARFVGSKHAVALSSGTAALHAAICAAGVGSGDEVIVPAMTFVATANAVVFQGGSPVFADVDPDNLLVDPEAVKARITSRTKAIIAVDYAGHPCDYNSLQTLARSHGLILIADSCHALGAEYKGRRTGTLADLTAFSFHPVKHITAGEGGMVVTDRPEFAARMRRFRNHGISAGHRERAEQGTWVYEMEDLGYNYRLTDFQSALGLSQLRKLPGWLRRRREIAGRYDAALAHSSFFEPLRVSPSVLHAYHLYVIRLASKNPAADRASLFQAWRKKGIGVNVHYLPVHLHPYYRKRQGGTPVSCPQAEKSYERILSLPIFPAMTSQDILTMTAALRESEETFRP